MSKVYDPAAVEGACTTRGSRGASSTPSPRPGEPFTIVIPPPNVTDRLHLGHALNNTLQDILIRWRRMQGRKALWVPGTDHAGIATQAVVERRIFEKEKKNRHDLGREELVRRIWAWRRSAATSSSSSFAASAPPATGSGRGSRSTRSARRPSGTRSSGCSRTASSIAASGWSTGTRTCRPPSPTTRSTTRTSRATSGTSGIR